MRQLYLLPADFEALIRIYSPEEGGRKTPTLNGIRWDFAYADRPEEPLELFAIWPDLCDKDGDSIDRDEPLLIGIDLRARMHIINLDNRDFHRQRISVGTRFHCHEGARRVAVGRVTRLTGLSVL